MNIGTTLITLLLIVAGTLLGCSRGDPRHIPISSSSPGAFERWKSKTNDAFRSDEWTDFNSSLQELRLQIMANREASGHASIESALRSKIDGSMFREVLVIGLQAKLARLTAEREITRKLLNANASKTGILSNDGPFAEFERARAQQEKKLLGIDDDIRRTKRRLTDFGRY